MTLYGTCPICGAPLTPGSAPFTRDCTDAECGDVYAVEVREGAHLTIEEAYIAGGQYDPDDPKLMRFLEHVRRKPSLYIWRKEA